MIIGKWMEEIRVNRCLLLIRLLFVAVGEPVNGEYLQIIGVDNAVGIDVAGAGRKGFGPSVRPFCWCAKKHFLET